jgi:hypothetical protein
LKSIISAARASRAGGTGRHCSDRERSVQLQRGGLVRGAVARRRLRGWARCSCPFWRLLLGYFFGPKRDVLPQQLSGRAFRVIYDPDDPNMVSREESAPQDEVDGLPRDGLLGAGAVENLLTRLLR